MKKASKDQLAWANRADHLGMVFSRRDQPLLVLLLLLCLGGMGIYVWRQAARVNRLIDIDQRVPRVAKFQIDLNAATRVEVASLPGIGAGLADAIVTFREEVGRFATIEAVQNVSGIGPHTFREIRPFLLPIETLPTETQQNKIGLVQRGLSKPVESPAPSQQR